MAEDPSQKIHRGSPDGVRRVKVGADPEKAMKSIAEIQHRVQNMAMGKEDPRKLRADLISQYTRGLQQAAWPGASSVKGHRYVPVYCKSGGEDIKMDWELLPGDNGNMWVLGFCPECFRITDADVRNADQPLFIDGQLGRTRGQREANEKFVTFKIDGGVSLDDDGLLTVNRIIACPQKSKCGWIVKVTDGRAVPTSTRLFGGKTRHQTSGPIIIVKG